MIDPNFIYENQELVTRKYLEKGYEFNFENFSNLYLARKKAIQDVEELKQKQNEFNKKITNEKRKPTEPELIEIKKLSDRVKQNEQIHLVCLVFPLVCLC